MYSDTSPLVFPGQTMYLPWPPWAAQQKIEMILSLLHRPRWPRQVQSGVTVAVMALT
jgi:hypothetical protein